MLDEITLDSLTEEQFECFIEYYHENYLEDFKSDLKNLKNGGVEYPRTQNASPIKIKEPYEPSPKMYSYEQPSCLGSNFIGKTLRKSDQLHQTFEKRSIAMTRTPSMLPVPSFEPLVPGYLLLIFLLSLRAFIMSAALVTAGVEFEYLELLRRIRRPLL
ncbi:hypothetical protein Tco_1217587 [Tanacetum coccineum]